MTSLSSALPGTMVHSVAPARVSSRKPASRVPESGPWHVKQRSERIGRTSRLNSMATGSAPVAADWHPRTSRAASNVWREKLGIKEVRFGCGEQSTEAIHYRRDAARKPPRLRAGCFRDRETRIAQTGVVFPQRVVICQRPRAGCTKAQMPEFKGVLVYLEPSASAGVAVASRAWQENSCPRLAELPACSACLFCL